MWNARFESHHDHHRDAVAEGRLTSMLPVFLQINNIYDFSPGFDIWPAAGEKHTLLANSESVMQKIENLPYL